MNNMSHLTETQLNEYLDQMLDNASRQKAETHLADCEQCRAELAELEMLFSTLDELPDIPLTRNLRAKVLARLPQVTQSPALWKQPVFMMQAILTLALVVVSMPMLTAFGKQIAMWRGMLTLPAMHMPSLAEIAAQLLPLLPEFSFALPKLSLTLPTAPRLPSLPFSLDANLMLTLVSLSGILWLFGNLSLLRNKPEVQE